MYSSLLALLSRSLRIDVRSRGAHLARMALMVAIYLSVILVNALSFRMAAPGLMFFRSILSLNLVFLTLIGIGAFSSTISEEKEEDALGLLRMAGVDPLGLLLGKMGGRLLQTLALLIVQYPFTLLSITMGGVSAAQVQAAYVALFAYLILMAGLGVFCSTIENSTRGSARMMVGGLLLYWVIPLMCRNWLQSGEVMFESGVQFLSRTCIFLQTEQILSTGYASVWNAQFVSNIVAGVLFFLLAWGLFDIFSRGTRTEPITRGFVTHAAKGFRWFNPGRPMGNALAWKDFHFSAGGIAGLLIRTFCYLAVFTCISLTEHEQGLTQIFRYSLMTFVMVLPFDASLLISRAMQDEVRGQTIAALVMLPRSIPGIVYSKLRGALSGLIPGLTCISIAMIGSGLIQELFDASTRHSSYYQPLLFFPSLLLLPHLTAVIALVARWGATPLAMATLYAITIVEQMLMLAFAALFMPSSAMATGINAFELQILVVGLINLVLCAVCHYEVMRRFRALAEK